MDTISQNSQRYYKNTDFYSYEREMIKRWEAYNNRRILPVRSLYRNPITMEGDYPLKDLAYRRDLTPSNNRDYRKVYDKPDQNDQRKKRGAGSYKNTPKDGNESVNNSQYQSKSIQRFRPEWKDKYNRSVLEENFYEKKENIDSSSNVNDSAIPLKKTSKYFPGRRHFANLHDKVYEIRECQFDRKKHVPLRENSCNSVDQASTMLKMNNYIDIPLKERRETKRYEDTHDTLNYNSGTYKNFRPSSKAPKSSRRDTSDFKDVMYYGYASHREHDVTDKITNIGKKEKNPFGQSKQIDDDSQVDLTNVGDIEIYVDRSIREGYTGRVVPKKYHDQVRLSCKDGNTDANQFASIGVTKTNVGSPLRDKLNLKYSSVTQNPTPMRINRVFV